jgi:hypothetical protein
LAISIREFGASGGGNLDDGPAINAAIQAAKRSGNSVHIPTGIFAHSGLILVDGVEVHGEGDFSVLKSSNVSGSSPHNAVMLSGSGAALRRVKVVSSWQGSRQENSKGAAVLIQSATDYEVSGVHVDGAATMGILSQDSHRGRIIGNVVENTLADGIHQTNASSDIIVAYNRTENTGDDCIAVVSYGSDTDVTRRVTIVGNILRNGKARGVTVDGGESVSINGNVIYNPAHAAFMITSAPAYNTKNVDSVSIVGNTVDGAGSASGSINPSVMIAGRPGHRVRGVVFSSNVLTNLRYTGLHIGADAAGTEDVIATHNRIYGLGGSTTRYGVYLAGVKNLIFDGNVVSNFASWGLVAAPYNEGYAKIINNHLESMNTANGSATDVMHMHNSGFKSIMATGNSYATGESGGSMSRLLEFGPNDNDSLIDMNFGDVRTVALNSSTPAKIWTPA